MHPATRLCRGCDESKPFVKSHIIPEAFCKQLIRGGKPPVIVAPDEFVKISQRGIYDATILCNECEAKLSAPDDYAQHLLIQEDSSFESLTNGTEISFQQLAVYDYALLHRFALSILWRASISNQPFFSKVDLGPHEAKLKSFALGEIICPADQYKFVVGRLIHKTKGNAVLAPVRERIDGVNYWRVYVGDWHFWIKDDQGRATPPVFKEIEATPGKPLIVLCRDFKNSAEYKSAVATARLRRIGR